MTTAKKRKTRIVLAPVAIATDGSLLLNIAITDGPADPRKLLERALAQGGQVFIGVVATPREVASTKKWIADTSVEILGALWDGAGRRHGKPRRRSA